MDKQQIEQNILFAERVPLGDRWKIIGNETIYNSLTEALNAYYVSCVTKPQAFRLEPLKGKLYVIIEENFEVKPKTYNIYGEDE
jgi:hypothetical protein